MILAFIGECPESAHCNFLHKTMGLLSDLPHLTSEVVLELVTIVIGVLWARWMFRREHKRIDREHGVPPHD